jgi:high affinity sulfate transporter 1
VTSPTVRRNALRRAIPALEWLPRWRADWRRDAVAALAVWAVLVPQSMAYAALAGVPPVYGLYGAIVGLVLYGLLGTSRELNVGPSSSLAVMTAATVAPLAAGDGGAYVALSSALALVTGVVLVAGGIAKLGFVAGFLARPVLAGYFVGLALTIVLGQLPALLGVPAVSGGFFAKLWELLGDLSDVDGWTAALGLSSLVLVLVLQRIVPRAPAALIAVVLGVLATRSLDLGEEGVALVGRLPTSLPELGLPDISTSDYRRILWSAAGIALLAYAESLAAARQFALRRGYEIDPNRELVAVGVANVGAGLAQGFPIDASVSRTNVAVSAGQRSQLAGLLNAGLVVVAIVALGELFADLPKATLAAIVIGAVLPLLRTGELRRLWRLDTVDFALGVTCTLGVLLAGVLGGIVIAVIASLAALVYRSYTPHTAVLGRLRGGEDGDEDFGFRDLSRHPDGETYPGLVILRFDQEIFFANAQLFRDAVRELITGAEVPVQRVIVDASAITHVDTTGLDMLGELQRELDALGVELVFARLKGPVHDVFKRAEKVGAIRHFRRFPTLRSAVADFLAHEQEAGRPWLE